MRIYHALRQVFSSSHSTIYALSTPPGRSAIAIVRVSGPSTRKVPLKNPPLIQDSPNTHELSTTDPSSSNPSKTPTSQRQIPPRQGIDIIFPLPQVIYR